MDLNIGDIIKLKQHLVEPTNGKFLEPVWTFDKTGM